MTVPMVCEVCGTKHYSYQAHVFAAVVSQIETPSVSQSVTIVSHEPQTGDVANTYRYRDEGRRREYQRLLMQLRRAIAGGKACAWPA